MSQNKYFPVRRIFFGRHFGHSDAKKKKITIIRRKRKKAGTKSGFTGVTNLTMWLLGLWTSLWEEHFPDGHWSNSRFFFFLKQLSMVEMVEVTCPLDRIWYHPRDGWCLGMSVGCYPYGYLCGKTQPLRWSGSLVRILNCQWVSWAQAFMALFFLTADSIQPAASGSSALTASPW